MQDKVEAAFRKYREIAMLPPMEVIDKYLDELEEAWAEVVALHKSEEDAECAYLLWWRS